MHFSFIILPLVASGIFVSAATATTTDRASLQSRMKEAQYQEAKAGRLVARAKTYAHSADTQHKKSVFAARQKKWQAEAAALEEQLSALGNPTSARPSENAVAATPVQHLQTTSRAATTTRAVTTTPVQSSISSSRMVTSVRTSTTSSAAATATATRKVSKKGICYNDAPLTLNLNIGHAYNWAQKPDGKLGAGVEYMPQLWGKDAGDWETEAPKQIAAGAKYLLGFNEPDLGSQADMTVGEAVDQWKRYMSPLADDAKLVSPVVTNGGAPGGVTWLQDFFDACPECKAESYAVALHWYDSATNIDYFKNYLRDAHKQFNKPIFLTEFAGAGSVAEQTKFFNTVIPWMEEPEQSYIERYAAFGDFAGTFVDASGALTELGHAYNNA